MKQMILLVVILLLMAYSIQSEPKTDCGCRTIETKELTTQYVPDIIISDVYGGDCNDSGKVIKDYTTEDGTHVTLEIYCD